MELKIITNDDSDNVYLYCRNFLKYKINKTINFENGIYFDLCTDSFSINRSYLIGINIKKDLLPTFYEINAIDDPDNIIIKIGDMLENFIKWNVTIIDFEENQQIYISKNINNNQISRIVLSKNYYN